jgi:hypothetical protein
VELARRAELNVIGKKLLILCVRQALDDDIVRLQLEARNVHESVLDTAPRENGERYDDKSKHFSNRWPANVPVQSQRQYVEIITTSQLRIKHCVLPVHRGPPNGPTAEREVPMHDAAPPRGLRSKLQDVRGYINFKERSRCKFAADAATQKQLNLQL